MSLQRIRKGDVVIAVSGVGAGKTGKVLEVLPGRGMAVVEGLNIVKKAVRKSQKNPQGGFLEREAPVRMAKLMLYCPHDKKGVRMARVRDGDTLVRKCKVCGHVFGG
ncbi:MAG: 50S ribosomal protein L24 [Lentisphaerae bacterium]|nr:50S ribosomal protein L24 [Lentisphaerota bacterium]